MKKTYFSSKHVFAFMLLLAGFIYGCRKELAQKTVNTEQNPSKTLSVANAKSYLDSALKTNSTTIKFFSTESSTPTAFNGYLFWDKAKAFSNKNFEVVEVPVALDYKQVSFYKLSGDTSNYITNKAVTEAAFTRVLIFRDSTKKVIDKRIITYIPDKSYLSKNSNPSFNNWINSIDKNYNGYIEYRTWENVPYLVLRLTNGKVKANYNLTRQNNSTNVRAQSLKTNSWGCDYYGVPDMVTVCGGGECDTHDNGTYTHYAICYETPDVYSPEPTFADGSSPTISNSGGSSTTSPTVSDADIANATYVDDGKPPINPAKYINCFTDGKTASQYKLTLYVAQPTPGSNDQISFFSNRGETFQTSLGQLYNVGHAFVGFQKINNDGSSVTQVIGFYPNPQGIVSKGSIKDDSSHPFDVSYNVTVSASQFQTALGGVIYDNGFSQYILSSYFGSGSEYNCVDAARSWLMNAGVALPQSTNRGSFLNSPGDYGQALRSFSGANTTSGNAPNSHGPCN